MPFNKTPVANSRLTYPGKGTSQDASNKRMHSGDKRVQPSVPDRIGYSISKHVDFAGRLMSLNHTLVDTC